MKILGVDIGTYSVKVAELDSSSKGYTFSGFTEIPLSLDPQKDRGLQIIEALRAMSVQYDPSNTHWVMGVPQHRVSIHKIRFPFRERPKIIKSLAFELEDDLPLDIDETVFDAKIISTSGNSSDVLTIASPKEAVEEVLAIAKNCDFELELISVEGLALDNMFSDWDAQPPELPPMAESIEGVRAAPQPAQIILQLGHTRTTLLVHQNGTLVNVRTILWGGADIALALSEAFSVPMFEAVKLLQSKSFILMNKSGATKDQLLLSNTISTALGNLMRELRLILLEIRADSNLQFDRIELSGGVSQIQNLGSFVTQQLEIPTNVAHPLERVRQSRVEETEHISAVSALAIGLAIEGLKRPRNPAVNLRKLEFALENKSMVQFWQTWRVPIQIAIAAFVIFCAYSVARDTLASGLADSAEAKIVDLGKTVANLKGASDNETGLRTYITKQKKTLKDREDLADSEKLNSALDILAKISEKMPVERPPKPGLGLNVSRVNIDFDEVEVEGRAALPSTVSLVEKGLGDLAVPKSLKKMATSGVPPGPGVAFAFAMKVERKPQ
jgi:general secretion pathway protein L